MSEGVPGRTTDIKEEFRRFGGYGQLTAVVDGPATTMNSSATTRDWIAHYSLQGCSNRQIAPTDGRRFRYFVVSPLFPINALLVNTAVGLHRLPSRGAE